MKKQDHPMCPVCGREMQPKIPEKQSQAKPYLGPPLVEFECTVCPHVEGHHNP